MQRDIGIIHIDPEAHSLSHLTPCLLVCPHALLTLLVERLHTVGLDGLVRHQIQSFLDFNLYRKSMSVPSTLPLYYMAFHGFPSTNHVLEQPREDMMYTRLPIGCRWSLEEGEWT
uniref:Uncharacterized protein n=1 Tax=uncultured marine group II/III euryarchaeote KM3_87_C01 TaxID=1456531 RepID=A0A075I0M4_9EURY|nr:hypothetical protein [uncultured marine group II/III euryarchaeote KM3_87_C01]